MKTILNKVGTLIKDNKFISVVVALIIFALIGPIFFGDLTGDLIMSLLPDWAGTVVNTLVIAGGVYLGVMILFLFGTGIYNVIVGNKGVTKKEEDYKTVKIIAKVVAISTSIILTYLVMFA